MDKLIKAPLLSLLNTSRCAIVQQLHIWNLIHQWKIAIKLVMLENPLQFPRLLITTYWWLVIARENTDILLLYVNKMAILISQKAGDLHSHTYNRWRSWIFPIQENTNDPPMEASIHSSTWTSSSLMKKVSWFLSNMVSSISCLSSSLSYLSSSLPISRTCFCLPSLSFEYLLHYQSDIIIPCTSSTKCLSEELNWNPEQQPRTKLYLVVFFCFDDRCIKLRLPGATAEVADLSTIIPCPAEVAAAAAADPALVPCTKHIIMDSFTSLDFINSQPTRFLCSLDLHELYNRFNVVSNSKITQVVPP